MIESDVFNLQSVWIHMGSEEKGKPTHVAVFNMLSQQTVSDLVLTGFLVFTRWLHYAFVSFDIRSPLYNVSERLPNVQTRSCPIILTDIVVKY